MYHSRLPNLPSLPSQTPWVFLCHTTRCLCLLDRWSRPQMVDGHMSTHANMCAYLTIPGSDCDCSQ